MSLPRLFIDAPLAAGGRAALTREQANYLLNVMRLGEGDSLIVFNGRDGEWRATIAAATKKAADIVAQDRLREQTQPADLHLLFAPLKHARLDYMVQKAVEMGASRLVPVLTRRTQVSRLNAERMRTNSIEAAEQCEILNLPDILPEAKLDAAVAALEPERLLIFCDEEAEQADPVAALDSARGRAQGTALLIGPEGGFDPQERAMLLAHRNVLRLSLGPRILRADTAAVAALALVQARLGDWPRL